MEGERISTQKIFCWGPRDWALNIGIFQTIGSILFILFELSVLLAMNNADREKLGLGVARHLSVVLMIITIIIWIFQLLCGLFLICGVKQRNIRKVTVWFAFTILFVPLTMVTAVWRICTGEFTLFVLDVVLLPVSLFSIWVVNLYRQQLLNSTGIAGFLQN